MNFIVNLLHFHLEFAFKYLVLFNFWGLRLRPTNMDLAVAGKLPPIDPARFVPGIWCKMCKKYKCTKNGKYLQKSSFFRNSTFVLYLYYILGLSYLVQDRLRLKVFCKPLIRIQYSLQQCPLVSEQSENTINPHCMQ